MAAATEAAMAAAAAQRAADLEIEKAQQEAEQASRAQRFDMKDGRALLVRSARSGLAPSRDDALLMVALAAALEPAADTTAATSPTIGSR